VTREKGHKGEVEPLNQWYFHAQETGKLSKGRSWRIRAAGQVWSYTGDYWGYFVFSCNYPGQHLHPNKVRKWPASSHFLTRFKKKSLKFQPSASI
jgi:hypothetical protein